jgi:hypothetical protein
MEWVGHVARMGAKRNAYRIARRDHWEDQDKGGWTILKWILDRIEWYGLH